MADNLQLFIESKYGNYVLQEALKRLPYDLRQPLVEKLEDFRPIIQELSWGIHINIALENPQV